MANYWVMRTDRRSAPFIWAELKDGRLRQGWGYDPSQNLEVILAATRSEEKLTDEQASCWRRNRRLLSSELDGIQQKDIVIAPHLPNYGVWSIARVVGGYQFDIPESQGDYGHILTVELLTTEKRPVNPYEETVSARLRQTMRNQLPLWNINGLGPEVERIISAIQAGVPAGDPIAERLPLVLYGLEGATWREFQHHYKGAEFEKPCVMLLKSLYGEDNVEHTGGKNERGADAICSYIDPLSVEHRVAVQIKMWEWDADWTRPLDQIRQAYHAYEGITAAVIFSTSEKTTNSFEAARAKLEKELRIPVRVILRKELLKLFISHLPKIVVEPDEPKAQR